MDVEERPVLSGVAALVAVAVVVGLVAGFAALAGARIVGLGGETEASGNGGAPGAGETLVLPTPSKTQEPTGPLVTLAPGDERQPAKKRDAKGDSAERKRKPKKEKQPKSVISLSASQLSVSLNGTRRHGTDLDFPAGEVGHARVRREIAPHHLPGDSRRVGVRRRREDADVEHAIVVQDPVSEREQVSEHRTEIRDQDGRSAPLERHAVHGPADVEGVETQE